AGHRYQSHANSTMPTVARPLPGRADGYPSGPPTDPHVRNERMRFLKQSCCYPFAVRWPAVVRVGELDVSPLSPASGYSARRHLLSCGSLGPHFPTFRGFACHSPSRYLACFHAFVVSLAGSCPGGSATDHARAFGRPVPYSGYATRRQVALPSSRVTPL